MKNVTFETNEENTTGGNCEETGTYLCNMHPYIEKYLNKGDTFPKCDQKGMPHNTTWSKIIQENEKNNFIN